MTSTPSDYEPRRGAGGDDLDAGYGLPAAPGETTWPPAGEPTSSQPASTKDVAKDEASSVKDTAVSAGQDVAATAKDQAANVAAETKQQAKSLFGSVISEVQSQAGSQQQKVASSVHSLAKELGGMASGSSESGPLTDLAHQGAQKGGELAHWLDNHEPRDVLREVQSFARRRPVAFLAICGFAGVVAGRLTRGAVAANTSIDSPSDSSPRAVGNGSSETGRPASLVEELPTSYESTRTAEVEVPGPAYVGPANTGYADSTGGFGSSDPAYGAVQPGNRSGGVR